MPLGVEPQRLDSSVHGMDVRAANSATLPLVIEQLVSAEDDEAQRIFAATNRPGVAAAIFD